MIRVFKTGAHSHRTPLSYRALAPLFADQIRLVETPDQADLYVFGHILDLQSAPQALVRDWRRRQRPIVLLSEEPFWDTIWGRQPLARQKLADSPWGRLPLHQLTHHSSPIFHFDCIPYYLLTNHRFANAYAARFSRNARRAPADWRRDWAARPVDLTFMFERRPEPHHSVCWPEGDIEGLCAWRTEVASSCQGGTIERLGRSWQPGQSARQALSDWHLDKLTQLDGRSRMMGAFENTHQPHYITEKLFDAFACGALPAYVASSGHRLHDLGLPAAAWLNLAGCTPAEAATRLDGLGWDNPSWLQDTSEAYALAQQKLADLFATPRNWQQERNRLRRTLLAEFHDLLDSNSSRAMITAPAA